MQTKIQQVIEDIFIATGKKVEAIDPIVIAALVQSKFISDANDKAIQDINHTINNQKDNIEEIIKNTTTKNYEKIYILWITISFLCLILGMGIGKFIL